MPFGLGEMTLLRRHADHMLISRCSISRPTFTSDGAGGRTKSLSVVQANVKCRLSPVRNDFEQERIIAERLGASIAWILSVTHGTDIRLNDLITMSDPLYGNPMEVQAVLTDPRSISTVIRVVVLETK